MHRVVHYAHVQYSSSAVHDDKDARRERENEQIKGKALLFAFLRSMFSTLSQVLLTRIVLVMGLVALERKLTRETPAKMHRGSLGTF